MAAPCRMLRQLVLLGLLLSAAAGDTTKAQESTTKPPATTPTTTPKPKVDVLASELCKKCKCIKEDNKKQLDCNNKSMSKMFSNAEWEILQNGDFTFDTIKLEHNKIENVTKWRAYPVENLYLGFNEIASIEKAAFSELTKLTILSLSHNKLTAKALDPDVFAGTYSTSEPLPIDTMRELDLGHNELHTLDPDIFEHLPKLETLVLCENTFQVINTVAEIAITGLNYLKTLDLSYMELRELPADLLHGPRDLETLILSGNLFETVPDEIEKAINLKRLVLDDNPIGYDAEDLLFPKLPKLEYLSISSMPNLTTIGPGTFSELRNLQVLVASDNPRLEHIDPKAFSSPTSNALILDYPPIRELYLHNNNLSGLDRELLARWDRVKVINLQFNPWQCNRNNEWLVHILLTQIHDITPSLTENVACARPAKWKNTLLIDLNTRKVELDDSDEDSIGVGMIFCYMLVSILVALPISIGVFMIYRRGCFGMLPIGTRRRNGDRALYKAAEFSDDFHI